MKVFLFVVGIFIFCGLMIALSYNSMASLKVKVDEQSANIDAQFQRRADLIPNLVEVVKGFASHESEVFSGVTKAREKLLAAKTIGEKSEANSLLTRSLMPLFGIVENYPQLKSDKVYVGLMDELAGTENRIAYARESYNKTAAEYNKEIITMPNVFLARLFGFEKVDYYKKDAEDTKAPKIDLKN